MRLIVERGDLDRYSHEQCAKIAAAGYPEKAAELLLAYRNAESTEDAEAIGEQIEHLYADVLRQVYRYPHEAL